jgi:hypothetical protein
MKRILSASTLAIALATGSVFAQTVDENADAVQPGVEPVTQQAVIERQQSNQLLTADLIGANVLSRDDAQVGSLDGILFDENGTIVGGIVAVGGLLGIGAKDVALSWEQFDVRTEENLVYIDMTEAQLEAAPAFKDRDDLRAEQQAERAQQELIEQQDRLMQENPLDEERGQTEQVQ